MTCILDTSALLAVILDEPGIERVRPHLGSAQISVVNLCEVYTRLFEAGVPRDAAEREIARFELRVRSFRETHAIETAMLRSQTRHLGLSMGDRACLSLAKINGLPILTADRAWAQLDIGVDIRLIR
ncbi:type II toxin-antitoxin system VapC family toxin [Sphingobium phenoxybenzoativorans]|uniref:type II toxin-antitoxin system VapC family toxin n=1 Tax=Sphingobium phenoxybenzoativorans TaxID=1592790 RepID=UPI000873198B|nr:type II toxin-antitoxin system VapC family toxin [Sphingobium phenoxybenzoativorans]